MKNKICHGFCKCPDCHQFAKLSGGAPTPINKKGTLKLEDMTKLYNEALSLSKFNMSPSYILISPKVYKRIRKIWMSYPWYTRWYYNILDFLGVKSSTGIK
jgi:hypothetical protein